MRGVGTGILGRACIKIKKGNKVICELVVNGVCTFEGVSVFSDDIDIEVVREDGIKLHISPLNFDDDACKV